MANLNQNVQQMVRARGLGMRKMPAVLGQQKPMKLRPAQTPNYLTPYKGARPGIGRARRKVSPKQWQILGGTKLGDIEVGA